MKKMNFASITAGLDTLKDVMQQNAEIAQDKLIDVSFIDFAPQNTFAADDTDESIRELADSIELLGLLEPLVVVRRKEQAFYALRRVWICYNNIKKRKM